MPDSPYPHTQLGKREGGSGTYRQTREWENGQPIKDTDWTNHGRKDHTDPHDHWYKPNPTGGTPKRGGPELTPKGGGLNLWK